MKKAVSNEYDTWFADHMFATTRHSSFQLIARVGSHDLFLHITRILAHDYTKAPIRLS